MKPIFLVIFSLFLFSGLRASENVYRIVIDGVINPIAAEYVQKSIAKAEEEDAQLLVIQIDTPGGLMESMHMIMKSIQNAKIPVAVFVAPVGARAGSAGVYITYSAHIAAMAPSTNIGSAHPVFGGGENKMDSTTTDIMMDKVTNDAVAKIRAAAERYGRNADWAEKAVRESANITESEALKLHVVDYVVADTDSLLAVVDGKVIKLSNGEQRILKTRNAPVITIEMTWRQRFFDVIVDPNIAAILMMIGTLGIMLELYSPGTIVPGVAGGICLILAFYAMQTLPLNYAGLFLIIFSIILFLLEIKVPSYGILSIGGIISLTMGLIMLIDSPIPELQVSWQVIVGIVLMTSLFFIVALGFALKAQKKVITTGSEGLIGETGVVFKTLNPKGTIIVHGEFWRAESSVPLKKGAEVKVIAYQGQNLTLKVEKI
jgi:membrane-bound serine protease (ClpP class)